VVILPDVVAASEIPWDEVGSGWFLLGYNPVKTEAADPWDEWFVGSGETWVLSPTGAVYQGPQPPTEARAIVFWPGSEVWFGLPLLPEPAEGACEPFSCGDVLAIDLQTGATRHPLASQYWPEGLERTADGSIVRWLECCDFGEATLIGADGADTDFSVIGTLWSPSLTPDGTALVWFDFQYEEPPVLVRTSFTGEEDRYPLPNDEAFFVGWIDESTVLISTFNMDDDFEVVDERRLAIDLESGLASEWTPPFEDFDFSQSLAPGLRLRWTSDQTAEIVSIDDGNLRIPIECTGDTCDWQVSGDQLLWIEEWMAPPHGAGESEAGGRQRVTLVDLPTGDQTLIFDAPDANGHIIDVTPHARVYE
jgi:hypothetical protein